MLKKLEKKSIAFAGLVVTPNIAFNDVYISRGCPGEKLRIIMNTPKKNIFDEGLLGNDAEVGSRDRGRPQRRICMVSYSNYDTDNRVMRYAEALAGRGDQVDVLVVKGNRDQANTEKIRGVSVLRIFKRPSKNQQSKVAYLQPILKFWAVSSVRLSWRYLKHRYDLVHVHNLPDFLVFTAWLPRLTGAKVILDIHDIVPEFFLSKFGAPENSTMVSNLKRIERWSARFSNHVIISNHLWLKPFTSRSAPEHKCSVFINYVNRNVFYRRESSRRRDRCIIMFPGGLQWHQGLDIAIRAMPAVLKRIPGAEFHIYGDGNMKDGLVALTRELGLTETVRFFDPRPVSEIAEVMSQADLGVVPKRADSFGNEAYSTKIMEFMSLGVPMVVSSTKVDRYYFNDSIVRFFESGNPDALAEAIVEVLQNDELRRRMIANALEYADQNSWQRRQGDYLKLVDDLIENRPVQLGGSQTGTAPDANSGREGRAAVTEAERLAVT